MKPVDNFRLGFGNDRRRDGSNFHDWKQAVKEALNVGYRHIDTAEVYKNEQAVGEAIAECDVPRDDLFVATKLHSDHLRYEDILEHTNYRLEALDLKYIDLLYVHFPFDPYDPQETMEAFNELQANNKIRHIGLSNVTAEMVKEAHQHANNIFAVQVEMHPLLQQDELLSYLQGEDIWLIAYAPLARGKSMRLEPIQNIANKNDCTPAQVTLAWLLSKDSVATIPKSSGEHIAENFRSQHVTLSEKDIERINSIEQKHRIVDPEQAPWNK